jgi:hypothetical protein
MTDEKHDSAPDAGSGGSPLSQPAHTLTYEAVVKELNTGLDEGLAPDEASRRLQQYGPNKLDEGEGVSVINILVRQVANAMMLVCSRYLLRVDISKLSNLIQLFPAGIDSSHGCQFRNSILDRGRSNLRRYYLEHHRRILPRVRRGKNNGIATLAILPNGNCFERWTDILSAIVGHRSR